MDLIIYLSCDFNSKGMGRFYNGRKEAFGCVTQDDPSQTPIHSYWMRQVFQTSRQAGVNICVVVVYGSLTSTRRGGGDIV
jgi:hypothetical protein